MMAETEEKEVMTLAETAQFLQLAEKTVLRMAQQGRIPAAKIASQWRFLRSTLRDWLASQMQGMSPYAMTLLENHKKDLFQFNDVIRPDFIKTDIIPGSKDAVLRQLIAPLDETGFAQKPEIFFQKIMEREKMMTTAFGHGIAMPHPRKPLENMFPGPAIVIGICRKGTDFDAIDNQSVYLFFLICATCEEIHLQLMAQLGWLCHNKETLNKLKHATSKENILELIKATADQRLSFTT